MQNGIVSAFLIGTAAATWLLAHYAPLLTQLHVTGPDIAGFVGGLALIVGVAFWNYLDKIGVAQKIAAIVAFVQANPQQAQAVSESAKAGTLEQSHPAALKLAA